MKPISFIALICFSFLSFAKGGFFEKLNSGDSEAKRDLLIFYSPDCPYCQMLEADINTDEQFQDLVKQFFSVTTIDISTEEGRQVAALFHVSGVPTIMRFSDTASKPILLKGYHSSQYIREFLFNDAITNQYEVPSGSLNVCGNGEIEEGENCDDGNMFAQDGCNENCMVEDGWICLGIPSICHLVVCGDGVVEGGESCDDDNLFPSDGCNQECEIEDGWNCSGSPSNCYESICGNGIPENGEDCDDGNLENGDGCESDCTITPNGIGDDYEQSDFIVAPNPFDGQTRISFFLVSNASVNISVYDVNGRCVYQSQTLNFSFGKNEFQLTDKDISLPGIYYLRIQSCKTESIFSRSFKLIKK